MSTNTDGPDNGKFFDQIAKSPTHPSPEEIRNAAVEEITVEFVRKFFDETTAKRLFVTRWKDGIDIDEPTQGLIEFVKALKSQPAQPTLNDSIATGIDQAISEGDGIWRSCTGCHEMNEGHDTRPYSDIFKCHLGGGCSECGGIGAIWDDTDYDAMADAMAKSMNEQPAQPSEGDNI